MTRLHTLRLLVYAEIPRDLPTLEAHLSELVARIDEIKPGSPAYQQAHARIDQLLDARDRIRATQETQPVTLTYREVVSPRMKADLDTDELEQLVRIAACQSVDRPDLHDVWKVTIDDAWWTDAYEVTTEQPDDQRAPDIEVWTLRAES